MFDCVRKLDGQGERFKAEIPNPFRTVAANDNSTTRWQH